MKASIATIRITGFSPYSQSRQHDEPALEGEGKDDYDKRTWRSKLRLSPKTGTVIIPQHGFHQALMAACKYSGKQIPGQGKKTWTAKFTTGIAIIDEIDTHIRPEDTVGEVISCNADGVRGSGKRVNRRFPVMYDWQAEFTIFVLDPIITQPVMQEMLEIAGMSIGLGRFRPEKGGSNGRFSPEILSWQDNRKFALRQ